MSTDVIEPVQTEAQVEAPAKKRGRKPKQAEAQAEAPTPASIESSQIEAALDAAMQATVEPEPGAEHEAKTPEKPSFDMDMGLFKGGANLFLKEENREAAVHLAEVLGVEVKNTKNGNPYLTVSADQIDQALDLVRAAGLSADDARPRAQERAEAKAEARKTAYVEKAQDKEALRFEGAGSFLIQGMKQLLQSGRTYVGGQELAVYQTKESQAEQAKIAEARAAGQDVKDKPIEIGVYDKRTETVIAKGTVERDDKGNVQVHVSLDQIEKANQQRPDNMQLIIPKREAVVESLEAVITAKAEVRASKPVRKAKDGEGR